MNKNETKYLNTARLMDEALIELLERKNYEYITVKEICEKAGVNRSTFYLHYETMNDLLEETVEYITSKMNDKFHDRLQIGKEEITSAPLDDLVLIKPEYLTPYLEFVKENSKVFRAVAFQPIAFHTNSIFNKMYDEIFNPILTRFNMTEQDKRYRLSFYLNGIYAVVQEWIKSGCVEDINYIAELLKQCIVL